MLLFIFEKEIKQISSGSINHNNLVTVSDFFDFFFFFIASKTHTEKKKKLHRINKVIKTKKQKKTKTNSEFTHLHGNILTNIKICYSSANSKYYCT